METGMDVLIIDDDEGNVRMARHVMPGISSCEHDECLMFLRREKMNRKVLISGDEGNVMDVVSIAFIAAKYRAQWVGVLSANESCPMKFPVLFSSSTQQHWSFFAMTMKVRS